MEREKNEDIKKDCLNVNEGSLSKAKLIKVLTFKVDSSPQNEFIENSLKAFENFVEGPIKILTPFTDNILVICNKNGKFDNSSLNKPIYLVDRTVDMIYGNFFLCSPSKSEGEFTDFPDNLTQKYVEYFSSLEDKLREKSED